MRRSGRSPFALTTALRISGSSPTSEGKSSSYSAVVAGATGGVLYVPSIDGGGSERSQWLVYTLHADLGLVF